MIVIVTSGQLCEHDVIPNMPLDECHVCGRERPRARERMGTGYGGRSSPLRLHSFYAGKSGGCTPTSAAHPGNKEK